MELDTDDTVRPRTTSRQYETGLRFMGWQLDRLGMLIMTLEALAFALLIGAQFLAAIFLMSGRTGLYPDARPPRTDRFKGAVRAAAAAVCPVG